MSVLIKGMEMPKDCDTCKFSDINDCKLWAIMDVGKIHPECPLVEIPAKHGRLIDEDNVIDAIHERLRTLQSHKEFTKKHDDIDLLGVMPYIAKIQSVVEAEGEE